MTISSSNRKAGPYTGNSLTTVFPFSFRVFAKADLRVIFTDQDGIESTLTLDSNYSVFLNEDQANTPGGTITYPHPTAILPLPPKLASGQKLTVLGDIAFEQLVDLTNNGGFYPDVIETALDKLTMQTLQLKEQVGRAIVANVSSEVTPGQYFEEVVRYTAEAEAAAASANAAATAASPVIPYLDEIGILAPIAPQIVEVAGHSSTVDLVGSNIGYVQAIGGDLAGSGWGYDLGSIMDEATQQATATSSIIAVADNLAAVQNASANATSAETAAGTAATKAGEAGASATNAASSASAASTSAANAATSEGNAASSATTASTKASEASTSATNAASSATIASTKANEAATSAANASSSATVAGTKAGEASTSATNAASSAVSALTQLNLFKGQYYGPLSADPALDPLGNAVGIGDLYFNTTVGEMRVCTGSAWAAAYISPDGLGALAYKNVVQSTDLDTTLDLGSI